jgi:hypothetical protein
MRFEHKGDEWNTHIEKDGFVFKKTYGSKVHRLSFNEALEIALGQQLLPLDKSTPTPKNHERRSGSS